MGTHPIFESDFDCLTDNAIGEISHLNTLEHQIFQDVEIFTAHPNVGFARHRA